MLLASPEAAGEVCMTIALGTAKIACSKDGERTFWLPWFGLLLLLITLAPAAVRRITQFSARFGRKLVQKLECAVEPKVML